MKRAALLMLVVGAPLALLLFPRLRKALVRNARLVLLLWAGAVLIVGLFAGGRAAFFEGKEGPDLLSALGVLLFLAAFLLVLFDARSAKNQR